MGASRLLVRLTLRTRPFWRSSPEMTSWLRGGVFERARFTSWPSPGGDEPLFDMVDGELELWDQSDSANSHVIVHMYIGDTQVLC